MADDRIAADDLAMALTLADIADDITMSRYLASDLRVETKPDRTPVTEADQAVERALRQLAERPLATGGARPAGAGPVGWDALAEASVGGKAAAALGLASLCSVARPTASGTYRTALTTTVVSASVACQD